MVASLGVNLRVTGHCDQGGRKYMEDVFSVAYQQTDDEKDLEYAYFGIFDGHGGREAAQYAKAHLMDSITSNRNFWSDDDQLVLKAIREGFLTTQNNMWKALPGWKKTNQGHPSTAGTTASICFIKRGKLFIGHVGDSGIILGERDPNHPTRWTSKSLTRDHKPDCKIELQRIHAAGGKVIDKAGVPRVVWYRPHDPSHRGPVRRSTPIDEVPFLAVARALGDLWSYNATDDVFVVSPDPDLHVYDISILKDRCLVLATDGAWNVLTPDMAIQSVAQSEQTNEKHMINPQGEHKWVNPSKRLVDLALDRWNMLQLRADNTSIVTVMLDPPGPPRAQVLRRMYGVDHASPVKAAATAAAAGNEGEEEDSNKANIAIISRFPNSECNEEKRGKDLIRSPKVDNTLPSSLNGSSGEFVRLVHDPTRPEPQRVLFKRTAPSPTSQIKRYIPQVLRREPSIPHMFVRNKDDAAAGVPRAQDLAECDLKSGGGIQVNEVSSTSPQPPPPLPHKTSRLGLKRELADLQSNASSLIGKDAGDANKAVNLKAPVPVAKTPDVSPRILRPRNTPSQTTPQSLKRKRRPLDATVASKILRSASKTYTGVSTAAAAAAATRRTPLRK